jgi:hypothetical protein
MQPIKQIIRVSFLILLVCGCTSQASSIEKNPVKTSTSKSSNQLQSYVWYDGQQKRTVWLNANLAADFQNDSVQTSQLKKTYPKASVILNYRSARIWQLPTQTHSGDTPPTNEESPRPVPSGYSPVFHDSANETSRIRALPGDIIVYLNPAWSNDKIMQWMNSRSLEIIKKIDIRASAYIVKTEPGMQALQIANTLFESGDVVAAFPDWWLESTTR